MLYILHTNRWYRVTAGAQVLLNLHVTLGIAQRSRYVSERAVTTGLHNQQGTHQHDAAHAHLMFFVNVLMRAT